ncbi:MAG: hypothetical protein WAU03_03800 [Candidatus Saccharimonas aalborgensis]|jgi:hypothetical protein
METRRRLAKSVDGVDYVGDANSNESQAKLNGSNDRRNDNIGVRRLMRQGFL